MNKKRILIILIVGILIVLSGLYFIYNSKIKSPKAPPNLFVEENIKYCKNENNCASAQMKYCETKEDCIPVECRCLCTSPYGFSYEDIVNKKYENQWYLEHNCTQPKPKVCSEAYCGRNFIECIENTCVVVEVKTKG